MYAIFIKGVFKRRSGTGNEETKVASRKRSREEEEYEYRMERMRRRRRQERRRQVRRARRILAGMLLLIAVLVILLVRIVISLFSGDGGDGEPVFLFREHKVVKEAPEYTEDFLTPNEYSRPGDKLGRVKNIFVHYTANRNTSAQQNRSYFEGLKDTGERSASAHFIIGYEGEIIQCIPFDEIAYAVKTRNMDSISIECCYTSEDGSFSEETYDSLIRLLAWLVGKYGLKPDDILRHYDCGGKLCPLYYSEHEEEWERLKEDVADYIEREG